MTGPLEEQKEKIRQEELRKKKIYLNVAEELSKLSKCVSYQVAAIIVRDGRILSTGINGTPKGAPIECQDVFIKTEGEWASKEDREKHHQWSLRNEIHAEMNAIIYAAREGNIIKRAEIYITHQPCPDCTKNLAAAGIKKIFYRYIYPKAEEDEYMKRFIKDNEMEITRIPKDEDSKDKRRKKSD